jgi:hypothetical protein
MAPPTRAYCRGTDLGSEGDTILPVGDKLEKQLSSLKDWLGDVDKKVDELVADGCSHRDDDLSKVSRIEMTMDGFRNDAGAIKDSIHQLSLSFEQYKTKVTESNNSTDTKINNLKFGVLVQCVLLLLVMLGFTIKEFVVPATKNVTSVYSEGDNRPRISVDIETWNKMNKREIDRK